MEVLCTSFIHELHYRGVSASFSRGWSMGLLPWQIGSDSNRRYRSTPVFETGSLNLSDTHPFR